MKKVKKTTAIFSVCIIGISALAFISTAQAAVGKRTGVCRTHPVSHDRLGKKVYGPMIALGYGFTREECFKDNSAKVESFWVAED